MGESPDLNSKQHKDSSDTNHGIDINQQSSAFASSGAPPFGQGLAQRPPSQNSSSANSVYFNNQSSVAEMSSNPAANLSAVSAVQNAAAGQSNYPWNDGNLQQLHQNLSAATNPILAQLQMQMAQTPQAQQQYTASAPMGQSNLQGQMHGASIPNNNISQHGVPSSITGPSPKNNSFVMPAWSGSVNVADFAMSESEVAEVNRFRQQGASSTAPSNHTQSEFGTAPSHDTARLQQNSMGNPTINTNTLQSLSSPASANVHSTSVSQTPLQNQNTGGESNSLGLQNASAINPSFSAVNSAINQPSSMNNGNLNYQQLQYLMMSGNNMQQQAINGISPQQQLLIQQNMQRQALQSQSHQSQRPVMGPASLQQQQHLHQYQQQQQHLQNIMMGGGNAGLANRINTSQSLLNSSGVNNSTPNQMMRPPGMNNSAGGNTFGFPNQASFQQQQQMASIMNQQQKMQQQQQQQQQQMYMQQGHRAQRIQSLPTFEGTSHAAFNDRIYFERHFANYVAQLGLPPPPMILGTHIDVFLLFHAVYPKGFEEVTRLNGWPIICHRLGLDTGGQTQALLHQYYQKCMLSLETNLKKEVAAAKAINNTVNSGQSLTPSVSALGSAKATIPATIPQGAPGAGSLIENNAVNKPMAIETPTDFADLGNTATDLTDSHGVEVKVENSKAGEEEAAAALGSASNLASETHNSQTEVVEDLKNEDKDKKYHPKIRPLKHSLGGIDSFRELFQIASRFKPVKEFYAPRNYHLLEVCLRSGLPAHIRWGLDLLTCVSFEQRVDFSQNYEFFLILVTFFKEQLEKAFGLSSLGIDGDSKKAFGSDTSSPIKQEKISGSNKKAFIFKSYADLYENEYLSLWKLQPNRVSSLDPAGQVADYASACSLILRNCSFISENLKIMSENAELVTIVINCLVLPTFSSSPPPSYPKTLEHRKNALIILSNLGELMTIPSASSASLILQICNDFIVEENGIYRYTALCAISKLLISERNQKVFESALERIPLVKTLLGLFPWTGFHFLTSSSISSSQLTEWEYAMTLLSVLVTPDSGPTFLRDVLDTCPDIDRIMFNLFKKPTMGLDRTVSSAELAALFGSLRERALRILFVLVKYFGQCNRYRHASWEDKLLKALIDVMASAELWSTSALQEFLVAEYASG